MLSENNYFLRDSKEVQNSIEEKCNVIKKENIKSNEKNEIKYS